MYFTEVFGPLKWHMLACVAAFYGVPALQYVLPQEYGMALYLSRCAERTRDCGYMCCFNNPRGL